MQIALELHAHSQYLVHLVGSCQFPEGLDAHPRCDVVDGQHRRQRDIFLRPAGRGQDRYRELVVGGRTRLQHDPGEYPEMLLGELGYLAVENLTRQHPVVRHLGSETVHRATRRLRQPAHEPITE